MDYKNEICPVCLKEFNDSDDIVVCPECGTPHHRECWLQNGCCMNASLHAEGFEWKKKDAPASSVNEAEADSHIGPFNEEEKNENPAGSPFSMPVMSASELSEESFEMLCMRGVNADKDALLDGHRIGDIAYYIQQNARHYINKFLKGKISVNWAALLFAPAWFFYRKLYKAGAIFLALTVAISLFTYPLFTSLQKEEAEIYEMLNISTEDSAPSMDDINEKLEEADQKKFTEKTTAYVKRAALLIGARLVPHIAAALLANWLYRRKIKKDLDIIDEAAQDKSTCRMLIVQRGGVSLMWGAVVFLAADYIVPVLMSAGRFFMDLF